MIKHPFNFLIGISCCLCFVSNVINGKDSFTIAITAIATIANIFVGLSD